jgi:hypothetical protein
VLVLDTALPSAPEPRRRSINFVSIETIRSSMHELRMRSRVRITPDVLAGALGLLGALLRGLAVPPVVGDVDGDESDLPQRGDVAGGGQAATRRSGNDEGDLGPSVAVAPAGEGLGHGPRTPADLDAAPGSPALVKHRGHPLPPRRGPPSR